MSFHKQKTIKITPKTFLAGGGNLRKDFIEEAKELELDHVQFLGRVPDEDLADMYREASAFVFPSTQKNEAFGMVLLEAFASGLPVVASNLPGVRTVVQNRGILVEPGHVAELAQGIEEMLQKGISQSSKQIRQATEKKFSWSHIMDEIEKVYNSVVK